MYIDTSCVCDGWSCDGIKYKTCNQDKFNQRTMAPTEIPPAASNLHDEPASEQPAVATAARHSAAATVINPYLKKKPQHDLIPKTVRRGNTSSVKKPQHELATSVRTAHRAAIANLFCPSPYGRGVLVTKHSPLQWTGCNT